MSADNASFESPDDFVFVAKGVEEPVPGAAGPANEDRRRFWGLEQPVAVLIAYAILMAALQGLGVVAVLCQICAGGEIDENLAVRMLILLLGNFLVITIVSIAWWNLTPKKIAPVKRPWLAVPLFLLFLPLFVLGADLYVNLMPPSLRVKEIPDCIRDYFPSLAVLLVSYCIIAPVFEELFFRRLVLDSLVRLMPLWGAVLLSALMFAFAHIGLVLAYPVFVLLGIYFGLARIYCNGIAVPMLLHGLYNAGVLYLFLLSPV